MDDLERQIMKNRDKMDIHEPDESLWSRIESTLPAGRRVIRPFLWRAAAVALVAAAGLTLLTRSDIFSRNDDQTALKMVRETDLYYNSLINSLYTEAEPLLTANPEVHTELSIGMDELDSISAEIRKDLKDNVATGEVIEALIRNYRLRIEMLEDMLMILKEEEKENEKQPEYEL